MQSKFQVRSREKTIPSENLTTQCIPVMMRPRKRKLYTFKDLLDSPDIKQPQQKCKRAPLAAQESVKKQDSSLMAQLDLVFNQLNTVSASGISRQNHRQTEQNEPCTSGASLPKRPSKKVRFTSPSQSSESNSQKETLAFLTQKDPNPEESKQTPGVQLMEGHSTSHSKTTAIHKKVKNVAMSPIDANNKWGGTVKKRLKQTKLLFGENAFNHIKHAQACRKHKASYRFSSQTSRLSDHVKSQSKNSSHQENQRKKSQPSKQSGGSQDSSQSQKLDSNSLESYQFSSSSKSSLKRSTSQNKSKSKKGPKSSKKGNKSCISTSGATYNSQDHRSHKGDSEDLSSGSYRFPGQKTSSAKKKRRLRCKTKVTSEEKFSEEENADRSCGHPQQSPQHSQLEGSQDSILESQILDSQGFLVAEKAAGRSTSKGTTNLPLQTIEEESETDGETEKDKDNEVHKESDNEETFVDEELIMLAEKDRASTSETPPRRDGEEVDLTSMWPSTGPFTIVTDGWEVQSPKKAGPHREEQGSSFSSPLNGIANPKDITRPEKRRGRKTHVTKYMADDRNNDGTDSITTTVGQTADENTDDLNIQHSVPDNSDGASVYQTSAGGDDAGFEGRHTDETISVSSDDEVHARRCHNSSDNGVGHRCDRRNDSERCPNDVNGEGRVRVPFARGNVSTSKVLVPETLDDTEGTCKDGEDDVSIAIPESLDPDSTGAHKCSFTSDDDFDAMVDSAVEKCLKQLNSSDATSENEYNSGIAQHDPERSHRSGRAHKISTSLQNGTPAETSAGDINAEGVNPHPSRRSDCIREPLTLRSSKMSRLRIVRVSEIALTPPERASVAVQTDISVLNDNDLSGAFDFYENAKEYVASYERGLAALGASQTTDSASSDNYTWDSVPAVDAGGFSGDNGLPKEYQSEKSGYQTGDGLAREISGEVDCAMQANKGLTSNKKAVAAHETMDELRLDRIRKKMRKLERKKKKSQTREERAAEASLDYPNEGNEGARTDTASVNSELRVEPVVTHLQGVEMNEGSTTSDDDVENQSRHSAEESRIDHQKEPIVSENDCLGSPAKKKKKKKGGKKRKRRRDWTDQEDATNVPTPLAFDLPVESSIPGPEELETLAREKKVSKTRRKARSSKTAGKRKEKSKKRPHSAKSLNIAFDLENLENSDPEEPDGELDVEVLPVEAVPFRESSPEVTLQMPKSALSDTESMDDFVVPDKEEGLECRRSPRLKKLNVDVLKNSGGDTGSPYNRTENVGFAEEDKKTEEDEEIFWQSSQGKAEAGIVRTEHEQIDICSESEDEAVGRFLDFSRLPDVFVSRMEDSLTIALTVL